jgi:hypothetical protein
MDAEAMRERPGQKPRSITRALRTDRVEGLAGTCSYLLGMVKPMSRGKLDWPLTLAENGQLPECGSCRSCSSGIEPRIPHQQRPHRAARWWSFMDIILNRKRSGNCYDLWARNAISKLNNLNWAIVGVQWWGKGWGRKTSGYPIG